MNDEVEQALLPLDTPRQINLKVGDKTFSYFFRRLTGKDWDSYYAGIVNHAVQSNGHRERVFESEAAAVALVESTLTRAEGFGDETALPANWQGALPLRHRVALSMTLRNVGASATQPGQVLCDRDEVRLAAVWPTEGKSVLYDGLIHRFKHLTPDQLKRFNYESARVRVEGDGKDAISIYPSRQLIAMKLYDELIDTVEGYSVAGHPLVGVEAIRAEMDGAHKAAAALQLFEGGEDVAVE